MILDVHPESGSRVQKSTGFWILNTVFWASQLSISRVSTVPVPPVPVLHNKCLLCNIFINKKGSLQPLRAHGVPLWCTVSSKSNVLTLALALLCARASLSRSFSYLSWASPPPPPSGGFGAGPFSTPPSFFGLSEPAIRKEKTKIPVQAVDPDPDPYTDLDSTGSLDPYPDSQSESGSRRA